MYGTACGVVVVDVPDPPGVEPPFPPVGEPLGIAGGVGLTRGAAIVCAVTVWTPAKGSLLFSWPEKRFNCPSFAVNE